LNTGTSDIDRRMRDLMAVTTPLQRLRMASSMFSTARTMVLAGPAAGNEDQRLRLFRRLYGRDFPEPQRDRILEHLRHVSTPHR
jgi:hypothetical protein